MDSLKEAFEDLIKDAHNAEKQIIKALPKMIKKTSSTELRQGFELHLEQTNEHAKKLEEISQICGFKPTRKVCPAMKGLIEEADEHLKEGKPGPVLDAVMIAAAQKVEHYEICGYGTAKAWAEQLGYTEVVPIIQSILDQEEATNHKLNQLAEGGINRQALTNESDSKTTEKKTTSSTKSKVSVR